MKPMLWKSIRLRKDSCSWKLSGIGLICRRYPLVYVEAVASAPWNRAALERPPFFKKVGRLLLLFARQRSLALGYGGRVGLHALLEAEGFYHRFQMPDYGPDPEKDDLVYFEYGTLQL